MHKLRTILRLLILLSFFAPFTTCNNQPSNILTTDTDTPLNSEIVNIPVADSQQTIKQESTDERTTSDKIIQGIISPTDNSTSGIGSIFFSSSEIGECAIGISLLISFFLVFPWKFLKQKRVRLYLLTLNLFSILIFATDILFSKDFNISWGLWLLIDLTLIELLFEFRLIKNPSSTKEAETNFVYPK
jgi:hypothetical protein